MTWFRRTAPAEPAAPGAPPAAPRPVAAIATWRVLAAILLCAGNVALSGLLLLQHHGQAAAVSAVEEICGPGADSGCAAVARSRWSAVAGMPVAAVGLAFYAGVALLLLLGLLAGAHSRAAAAALALLALALAVLADLLLLGIQAVAIRAFCRLCLLTYVLNALALVALLPARQDGSVVGEAVTRREGRLAFMAWLVASLAITAGVAIAELGLRRGQAASAGAVLGIPAGPAAAGGGAGEVERYREEARAAGEQARRLQEILDDPHKLEQYFADRAAREFEQAPVHMLDLAGVPLKGPAAAPIKVVEYSDFLCPFCRNVALAFNGYLPGSGGRVGVYYKNYPLDAECNPNVRPSVHEGACLLARGAICAQDQNRFWPYHDRVFGVQLHAPRQPDVVRLATEAGLDAAGFEQCLTSASARDRLAAQIAEAQRAGVNSTPTLFINGKRLPRLADFAATVDKEAARLGLPPLPQAQAR
jgi:protein-disulfide isomerase/uncharacterized membrane protein